MKGIIYHCFFDGKGACIMNEDKLMLHTYSNFVQAHKHNSNNVAEYDAFLWVVTTLIEIIPEREMPLVYIRGDSRLVIMQMLCAWPMIGLYKPIALKAKEKLEQLYMKAQVSLMLIPREENIYTDEPYRKKDGNE